MPFARVRVSLLPARNDPRIDSGSLQSAFAEFREFLRISDIPASTPMFYEETDVTAEGYVGEFILPLAQALRPPLRLIVSAWLQQRPGRAVWLRIGERHAVARTTEQAERFLQRARQLRATPSPSRESR